MTNSNVISNSIFRDAVKATVPTPVGYEKVGVRVDLLANLLEVYSVELYTQLENVVLGRGGKLSFTNDDFTRYIRTLVKIRIDYVNNNRPMFRPNDRVVVPAFISEVLSNLGLVSDLSIGVDLYPVYDAIDDALVFEEKGFLRVSNAMLLLANYGFEFALAMPRDKSGSWEFMTMFMINDHIVAPKNESHAVYALLASVLEMQLLASVYTPRVNYGNRSFFERIIRQIATLKVSN